MSVMHLWCFVLACKKNWVLDTSCCPDNCFRSRGVCRSTHKDTQTQKKTQVLLVVVLWFHPVVAAFPTCETQQTAQLHFFCTLPVPSLFFCTLPVPSLFFTLCRSRRFFFALCLSHCIFFALCPFHRFFFLHLSGHIAFFLHFVCHIAFFMQFGGCFVFFLQSPVPIAFFLQREDWRSQRRIFFARRICIIRLLQFRLHFSLHFCIYFAFFSLFFPIFFLHFELQVAKKMQREKHIGFHCFFFAPACSATSRVAFLGIRRVNPSLEAIRFPSFVLCQAQVGEFVTDDSRWKTRAKRERSSVLHIDKYVLSIYLLMRK